MKKIQYILLNNRRHLSISHIQRNTAEFFRIPKLRTTYFRILHKKSTQETQTLCKQARPHRTSCDFLADSTRCLQETKFHSARGSASTRMPTCVVVVSHIRRIGCQPEKTTLHGGQSRSWSAEQGKENKIKSLAAYPPPTPCSFGKNK